MALQPNPNIAEISGKVKLTAENYQDTYTYLTKGKPEVETELVPVWGKQSITGMLDMLQMEKEISADQYIWAENGKLTKLHKGVTRTTNVFTSNAHAVRVNDIIKVLDDTKKETGIVTATDENTFTAVCAQGAAWTVKTTALLVTVIGTEYQKGTEGVRKSISKEFTTFTTAPTIKKDGYQITGSDMSNAQLYTVEGKTFWYIPEIEDQKMRFKNNMECLHLENDTVATGSGMATAGYRGSVGLLSAIRKRGNNWQGMVNSLADIQNLNDRLEKYEGENYNALFLDSKSSYAIDSFMAGINTTVGYGVFDNSEKDKVMKLDFKGFSLGSYEYYKQGWNYLMNREYNPDETPSVIKTRGLMIPMGTTPIADPIKGNAITKVNYLTHLYKGMPGYSRKLQEYYDGISATPYNNGTKDYFYVGWLTEDCIRPAGLQRWCLFEGQ